MKWIEKFFEDREELINAAKRLAVLLVTTILLVILMSVLPSETVTTALYKVT